MNATYIFPIIIISSTFLSGVVCAIAGEWNKFVYWTLAAGLNVTATFFMK